MSGAYVKIELFSLIRQFQVIFYLQLSFRFDVEHASLTFNEFKVRIWNLLQIFNALLLFNCPVYVFNKVIPIFLGVEA